MVSRKARTRPLRGPREQRPPFLRCCTSGQPPADTFREPHHAALGALGGSRRLSEAPACSREPDPKRQRPRGERVPLCLASVLLPLERADAPHLPDVGSCSPRPRPCSSAWVRKGCPEPPSSLTPATQVPPLPPRPRPTRVGVSRWGVEPPRAPRSAAPPRREARRLHQSLLKSADHAHATFQAGRTHLYPARS